VLPAAADVDRLAHEAEQVGAEAEARSGDHGGVLLRDPSGNPILLTAAR
jgi:hypothetical protein